MKKRVQHLLKLIPLELLVLAIVFLLCLFIFSFIVHEAVYEREDIFDNNVIHFFSVHSSPALIEAMKRITFFGSTTFLFPAYIVLIAWQLFKKRPAHSIDIAVIAISSTAMMFVLKQFFHRHRPQIPIIKGISGYSFPSGHALSSFIFCSILMYLVWEGTLATWQKYLIVLFLLLCSFAIGCSRVILNVHYATDVIGGFCLGIAWVILSFVMIKKIRKNNLTVTGNPVS
jgi:membrane-associated phospholipid phosphatase